MSSSGAEADAVCANCGIAEVDDIKLEEDCDGCDLVKYCSNDCQENHRGQHEDDCKKRRAELRDKELLFEQPDENYLGECPLCFLPMSLDPRKSTLMSCCCKVICAGCSYANKNREIEAGLEQRCAFCREPLPKSEEDVLKRLTKRIKKNDPDAMREMGKNHHDKGDYQGAFEYFTKAAELGSAGAHYNLSIMYGKGNGIEKDTEKYAFHLEEAAIRGQPEARHNLGCIEASVGRFERAKKHFIIAANLGYHDSLKLLRRLYTEGHASKEDYANALRAYQAAVEATKSREREIADEAQKNGALRVLG